MSCTATTDPCFVNLMVTAHPHNNPRCNVPDIVQQSVKVAKVTECLPKLFAQL